MTAKSSPSAAIRKFASLVGAGTRRIDLAGRTATPGLIDSHAHIADAGVIELYHVELSDASTVAEAVRRVQAGIACFKPGEWLQGAGWDEGKLAERRYLDGRGSRSSLPQIIRCG